MNIITRRISILTLLLSVLLLGTWNSYTWGATANLNLVIDGQSVPTPESAYIHQGRLMVPSEFMKKSLGLSLSWNSSGSIDASEATTSTDSVDSQVSREIADASASAPAKASAQSIQISRCEKSLTLRVDGTIALVNGTHYTINPSPTMVSGSIMLPLRSVCELLDISVDWNNQTRTVTIVPYKQQQSINSSGLKIEIPTGTDKDSIDMMITLNLDKDVDSQYSDVLDMLRAKFPNEATVTEIIGYTKTKQQAADPLPLKRWRINQRVVSVVSDTLEHTILITIGQPST